MPATVGSQYTREDFINVIRIAMRDDPELNLLLEGLESSTPMVDWAINSAISEYNSWPPHVGDATFDTFPSFAILQLGTMIYLLIGAGILQSRNQLTFTDGGITVQISNKTGLYQSWIRLLREQYLALLKPFKRAKNAAAGYGGVSSEYLGASVHGFFGGDAMAGVIEMAPTMTLIF